MSKYSYEEKLEAVLRVINEGMSKTASGKILGVSEPTIHKWCLLYEHHGIEGLITTNGTYSGDFKIEVVEYMHANHLSCYKAAAKFLIPSKTQVANWERIYYEKGPQALYRDNRGGPGKMSSNKAKKTTLNKEIEEDLIAEVQRLRMENEYLKNCKP